MDRKEGLLFLKKKKQKDFAPLRAVGAPAGVTSRKSKFFCFFLFTKRRLLLALPKVVGGAKGRYPPYALRVQVCDFEGVGDDEVTAGFDDVAH
jgi:hypothetical protein